MTPWKFAAALLLFGVFAVIMNFFGPKRRVRSQKSAQQTAGESHE